MSNAEIFNSYASGLSISAQGRASRPDTPRLGSGAGRPGGAAAALMRFATLKAPGEARFNASRAFDPSRD